jgi:hypothetical protein
VSEGRAPRVKAAGTRSILATCLPAAAAILVFGTLYGAAARAILGVPPGAGVLAVRLLRRAAVRAAGLAERGSHDAAARADRRRAEPSPPGPRRGPPAPHGGIPVAPGGAGLLSRRRDLWIRRRHGTRCGARRGARGDGHRAHAPGRGRHLLPRLAGGHPDRRAGSGARGRRESGRRDLPHPLHRAGLAGGDPPLPRRARPGRRPALGGYRLRLARPARPGPRRRRCARGPAGGER